jgi:hypothetical protein
MGMIVYETGRTCSLGVAVSFDESLVFIDIDQVRILMPMKVFKNLLEMLNHCKDEYASSKVQTPLPKYIEDAFNVSDNNK